MRSSSKQAISTVTFDLPKLDHTKLSKLDLWLQRILWESEFPSQEQGTEEKSPPEPFEIHRAKGLILLKSGEVRMLQGVREIFEITEMAARTNGPANLQENGKIVLIGKGVGNLPWKHSLKSFIGV